MPSFICLKIVASRYASASRIGELMPDLTHCRYRISLP